MHLLFDPVSPAVSHVKIVKCVLSVGQGETKYCVANIDYWIDVNCCTSICPVIYSDVYIINVSVFICHQSYFFSLHASQNKSLLCILN